MRDARADQTAPRPSEAAADAALPPAEGIVRLADYAPPSHLIDETRLTFRLAPEGTRVLSRIAFRPNPHAAPAGRLRLDGTNLTPIRTAIDGAEVHPQIDPDGMWIDVPDGAFTFEAEVAIDPAANEALSGLYLSNGMFCTQCEAQGFRRITWYPDRPDVMAPFHVRIESDLPVLLSNGDLVAEGTGFAEWHDPHPKPSYLFALVAGDLRAHRDRFTTSEGREVALAIWTRPGPDEARCEWAMDSLKRSMRWDEEVWGRAYDLDIFNIVAVDDFNMGAMENKGLNIFNSAAVLAAPDTTTDEAFARIESIVAHEYFHNWTGNRITCRDWFQLCLKEGLTVYRDQTFGEDERGGGTERIKQVQTLRARQFREDAGPLAHPVRPESFVAIDNFYTATVYEKGAELVRMLRRVVGEEAWERGKALYFERHDGQACTVEDWLAVFADASGQDLSRFARWYSQAGTPRVHADAVWHEGENIGTLRITLRQETQPTPGQTEKQPVPIPVATGLIGPDGAEVLPTTVLMLDEAKRTFDLPAPEGAVPSFLRGFSAPVILTRESSDAERAFLLAHDTDPFARWEAGRQLSKSVLVRAVTEGTPLPDGWLAALRRAATDASLAPDFRALLLALPGEDDLSQTIFDGGATPDPDAIHAAREAARDALARALADDLPALRAEGDVDGPYSPAAEPAAKRALGLAALSLQTRLDGGAAARAVFARARNFTEEMAAFACLVNAGDTDAVQSFRGKWEGERLVMDRWFAVQVALAEPREAAATAARLAGDPLFDSRNPNRFRAVWGALAGNTAGFHAADGSGYDALAGALIDIAPRNPQLAARMTTAFETWRRHDEGRQSKAKAALERIRASGGLPKDVREMADRLIG